MLRFSANLSTLFQELPLVDRFAAAAEWFKGVELWFPYEIDARIMADVLQANGLVCVAINSPPGKVENGDWGIAVDPARKDDFLDSVESAMVYAQTIGCPNVHVMAGIIPHGLAAEDAWHTYKENITAACASAKRHGRQALVEPLNAIDRPAYLLTRQSQAIELIKAVGCDNLRIMVDIFHMQRGEGNLTERMRASLPYAGHVQIADVPGRHEPGTGEINFAYVFTELERLGWAGWVGCEYFPRTTTLDGLGWLSHPASRVSSVK